jgi:SAM-dependent methyltransferase
MTTLNAAGEWDTAVSTKLTRFLSAYWLRPENAFWMTLRSHILEPFAFESPMLDLSCGDGVFTYLHAGGEFDPSFDVFQSVANLDRVMSENADMFDHYAPDYAPPIMRRPELKIDFGTDLKLSMLTKAGALDVYDSLVLHDQNNPMPFETDQFRTIYGNAVYWVDQLDALLAELARITMPAGRILLQVKLDSIKNCTLTHYAHALGPSFLNIIDRGRLASWPALGNRPDWQRRFKQVNLDIVEEIPFVTATHAHIWDIGLRPIAPMLVKMANALTPQTRSSIKRDWVQLFQGLTEPLIDPNLNLLPAKSDPVEILYVLAPVK